MNIIQDFIKVGANNRPGFFLKAEYITIHDTANPSAYADAEVHAAYLQTSTAANRPASWHFTVDDHSVYQHLPLNENAWHAGDGTYGTGNRKSWAIEICENSDGNRAKAELNAAWLVSYLMDLGDIPLEKVEQHNHWSGKNCPHLIRARPKGWENFIKQVQDNVEKSVFSDISGNWSESNILKVAKAGYMNGYSDGTFKPDRPLTRAELAAVLVNVLKL